MQPLGRKKMRYNYVDNHPPKGYVNWWESEIDISCNKKADRQKAKKFLKDAFEDYQEENIDG
jgi:hypothetical protein